MLKYFISNQDKVLMESTTGTTNSENFQQTCWDANGVWLTCVPRLKYNERKLFTVRTVFWMISHCIPQLLINFLHSDLTQDDFEKKLKKETYAKLTLHFNKSPKNYFESIQTAGELRPKILFHF